MPDRKSDAPNAVAPALGADDLSVEATVTSSGYHSGQSVGKEKAGPVAFVKRDETSDGRLALARARLVTVHNHEGASVLRTVRGGRAIMLLALLAAGRKGVTTDECHSFGLRNPADAVRGLRHTHGFDVTMQCEPFGPGRYVLLSPTEIVGTAT
jgi:hypothetical protein